jgi:hypothetical protein
MRRTQSKQLALSSSDEEDMLASPPQRGDVGMFEDYNLKARSALNRYFTGWIDHHQKRKEKWSALIKYRYLVSRMRLNKMFWGWKLWLRQSKVNRLKSAILEHKRTHLLLMSCLRGWKQAIHGIREGLHILERVCTAQVKRVVLRYMQHRAREARAREVQKARAERYYVTSS